MPGSSPLARGLRQRGDNSEGATLDHPRSRGVYMRSPAVTVAGPGSSPLARGLPGKASRRASRARIIPARAGFTRSPHSTGRPRTDHPRSRGVYPSRAPNRILDPGSSPLARGLPDAQVIEIAVHRIIPARAGFTGRLTRPRPSGADHPRSRGVYENFEVERRIVFGSSPLARGLLPVPSCR